MAPLLETRRWTMATVATLAVCALSGGVAGAELQEAGTERWVTAWSTSQQTLGTSTVTDATVRMIARVTIAGEAVRLRIDNTFGAGPLVIHSAYVGQRMRGGDAPTRLEPEALFRWLADRHRRSGWERAQRPGHDACAGPAGPGDQPVSPGDRRAT